MAWTKSALLALLLVCGCGSPAPSGWQVSGGFVRAPDGRAAILRGVNLSEAQKYKPYLGFQQTPDYQRIRAAWGLNAVRFLMTWSAVEPARGHYDDAYLDAVAQRLGWAQQAGLAVVLDMHQDVYGEGFGFDGMARWTCDEARYAAFQPRSPWFLSYFDPNVIACADAFWTSDDLQARFAAAWGHVAQRLASAPAVIGFDVLNEPYWGSYPSTQFEQDRLRPAYERVVAAVRAATPGWLAFLEPGLSRNLGVPTGFTPFDFGNVVYAPHSYDGGAENGAGFDPSHRQSILDNVTALAAEARALGAALWVGEYGGVASEPGIGPYMDAQYAAMGAVAGSSMYWEYGEDDAYGILTPDGMEKPELADALARPYPERVAGDPSSWAWDQQAAAFTFIYRPDPSLGLPTEIVVPDRRYPNGYQVDCGGCTYQKQGDRLAITGAPAADQVTVTLRP